MPRAAAAAVAALALAAASARPAPAETAAVLRIEPAGAVLSGVPLTVRATLEGVAEGQTVPVVFRGPGLEEEVELAPGEQEIRLAAALPSGDQRVTATGGGAAASFDVSVLPGWLSIVPPLVAIGLALIFKDVLVSLFLGILAGALFLSDWNPFAALARSIDQFITPALADGDHAAVIVFSTLLGGMVGIISRSGGTQGIVDRITRFATTPRRGQVSTWLLGVVIFFDDYANSLIVGSTMRPITDRLRISREKLAYIVDSTAAPIASIVPISTWIGFEIGLIAAAFDQLGIAGDYNAYTTFIASIAYRFYPIFALVLGFTIAFSCRDFGPMLEAELRASNEGKLIGDGDTPLALAATDELVPPERAPKRAVNALLPIATVCVVTLAGLWITGSSGAEPVPGQTSIERAREVFSNADSFAALLWASLSGVVVALALAIGQRILSVRQGMEAMIAGFRSMLLAIVVLTLAWSIGAVCESLHTADYAVGLTQGILSPHWLPVLIFVTSAAISFATGASWGTMAILMPIVIPISHGLSIAAGYGPGQPQYSVVLVGTISSVLAGSVWGDHCSPISDTTILSSMASGSDHIAHVRTQMPYALAIGLLGMAVGDIPTAYGVSPWISLVAGSAVIVAAVLLLGRRSDWRPKSG